MLPASRCAGGITRPRDLAAVTKSRGSLERIQAPSLSSDARSRNTLPIFDRIPVYSHEAGDSTQLSYQSHRAQVGFSEERATLRCETGIAPPNSEVRLFGSDVKPRNRSVSHIDAVPCSRFSRLSLATQQTRGFHASPHASYDSTSYNVANVPEFFVKYKQQRTTLSADPSADKHNQELLGLMPPLTDSILAGDVVASIRRLKAKIPVEHQATEGRIIHPSGFVVPGPGHTSTSDVARAKERERNENKDRAVQTAAVAHCVLESGFEQVDATTLPFSHKVPFEVREPDGTVKHPSGFVPPTPAHKFRSMVNTSVLRDRNISDTRQRAKQSSPSRQVLRAMHTVSASKVSE